MCLPGGALLSIDQGFMGPNYSISTACATANYAFVSGESLSLLEPVWALLELVGSGKLRQSLAVDPGVWDRLRHRQPRVCVG